MSTMPTGPLNSAHLYLWTLTEFAPSHTLLDIRYRIRGHELGRLFLGVHDRQAPRTIVRIGQRTDVYVGCAPRLRRRGRREDVAPTPMLWADCDGPVAVAALGAFQPPASMIVASGSGENVHAYWGLTHPLTAQELKDANHRLAAALASRSKVRRSSTRPQDPRNAELQARSAAPGAPSSVHGRALPAGGHPA